MAIIKLLNPAGHDCRITKLKFPFENKSFHVGMISKRLVIGIPFNQVLLLRNIMGVNCGLIENVVAFSI